MQRLSKINRIICLLIIILGLSNLYRNIISEFSSLLIIAILLLAIKLVISTNLNKG